MKYFFTFISFLFLALTLQAQLVMEEIAYVPSPSGYYNNLVVKGNVNIKKLDTQPFSIYAYSSILTIILKNDATLFIKNLNIDNPNGSAFLRETTNSTWENVSIVEPDPERTEQTSSIPFYLNGGHLSATAIAANNNNTITVTNLSLPTNLTSLLIQTRFLYSEGSDPIQVKNLEIFGMEYLKSCSDYYRWQRVRVGPGSGNTNIYTVLVCNNSTAVQADSPSCEQ